MVVGVIDDFFGKSKRQDGFPGGCPQEKRTAHSALCVVRQTCNLALSHFMESPRKESQHITRLLQSISL